jgi:uncharacterized protein YcfL
MQLHQQQQHDVQLHQQQQGTRVHEQQQQQQDALAEALASQPYLLSRAELSERCAVQVSSEQASATYRGEQYWYHQEVLNVRQQHQQQEVVWNTGLRKTDYLCGNVILVWH